MTCRFDPSTSVHNPAVCSYCGSRRLFNGRIRPDGADHTLRRLRAHASRLASESLKSSQIFIDYAGGMDRFRRQKAEKEAAQQGDFLQIADRLERLLLTKAGLLEIGCAMGTTLNGFRGEGWQVLGSGAGETVC